MKIQRLTSSRLSELLHYNKDTGLFIFKVTRGGISAGTVAGTANTVSGYIYIKIDRNMYLAHHLAWFCTYGTWPAEQLDHINCNPADNRIDNLRLLCGAINSANAKKRNDNTSGFKGVVFHTRSEKFYAQICINGRIRHLGSFPWASLAARAYDAAATEAWGEYALTNVKLGLLRR